MCREALFRMRRTPERLRIVEGPFFFQMGLFVIATDAAVRRRHKELGLGKVP